MCSVFFSFFLLFDHRKSHFSINNAPNGLRINSNLFLNVYLFLFRIDSRCTDPNKKRNCIENRFSVVDFLFSSHGQQIVLHTSHSAPTKTKTDFCMLEKLRISTFVFLLLLLLLLIESLDCLFICCYI